MSTNGDDKRLQELEVRFEAQFGKVFALEQLVRECIFTIGQQAKDPATMLDEMRQRLLAFAEKRLGPSSDDSNPSGIAAGNCTSTIDGTINQAKRRIVEARDGAAGGKQAD